MTEKPTPEPNPFDFAAAATRYLAQEAEYKRHAENLLASNKAILFDALAAKGIAHVVVTFDGYGDSGQIESIEASTDNTTKPLPRNRISLTFAQWGQVEATSQTLSIADAIEHMVYDILRQTHQGWENNNGAYGEFTFDVAKRSITLDYNERFTSSENYSHEF